MPDIILHHYPESPFSEKVRLILGHKGLAWKSVTIPIVMPKPDVTALTGGYRRTPVMQIGADIYCDTALIADVLEGIAPANSLYPEGQGALARTLAQWADSTLFMTAVGYFYQAAGIESLLARMTLEQVQAFQQDRAAMMGSNALPHLAEASASLSLYLQRLQQTLQDGRPFLLGSAATLADFSFYHPLWFLQALPSSAGLLQANPRVVAWMERITGIGHGRSTPLSSVEAIAVARNSRAVIRSSGASDLPGIALGDRVVVMPSDYGLGPVQGELVLVEANHVALRRTDERAGTLVVHFPRIGFQIKSAGPAAS
jgi:glutathione S-transferase